MCNNKTQIPVIILIMIRVTRRLWQPLCNYPAGTDHEGKPHNVNISLSHKGSSGIGYVHRRGNSCQTTSCLSVAKEKIHAISLGFNYFIQDLGFKRLSWSCHAGPVGGFAGAGRKHINLNVRGGLMTATLNKASQTRSDRPGVTASSFPAQSNTIKGFWVSISFKK